MKTRFTLLLAVLISLFSCNDENEYTIILKESGNLQVQLVQDGTPISNETVYLVSGANTNNYYTSLEQYALDYVDTDINGKVDFGEINAGGYFVTTKGVEVGDKMYYPTKIFQMVSGNNKNLTIDISDYTGTVKLTILDDDYYSGYPPLQGINVAIITREDYYKYNDTNDRLERALENKITDSAGVVSFTLPSGTEYYAIAYGTNDYGNVSYRTTGLGYLEINEEYEGTMHFY